MAQPQLKRFETPEALAESAAEDLLQRIKEGLQQKKTFSVVLSGGSTPKRMYQHLAQSNDARDLLQQVDFFWGDERHVPPDHADSNYGAARDGLFQPLGIDETKVHRIKAEMHDAQAAALDYEAEVVRVLGSRPVFDLVFLGMGPDGHTASIFPGTAAVSETEAIVTAPWVEKLNSHRITLTYPAINQALAVLFLVTGADKAETVKQVLYGERNPDLYPSQLIAPSRGDFIWMLDQEAGRLV